MCSGGQHHTLNQGRNLTTFCADPMRSGSGVSPQSRAGANPIQTDGPAARSDTPAITSSTITASERASSSAAPPASKFSFLSIVRR